MIQILQQIISTLAAMVFALQATVAGLPANNQFAQVLRTATLTLSPSSTSVSVNNTFTANIIINTGSQSAYGADINRLRFNPAVLQVVDADSSTAGVQIAAGSLMPMTIINSIDNVGGSIQFSQLATPGSTFSGSGTLATITFRAVSIGTSNITFDFTLGSGIDTNVAGLGGDLLTSVGSGSYTGGTSSDTTAPSTPGTPSLTVVSSSQINLSWTASTDNVAVTGYRVERCSGSTTCSNYSQIATPSTNSYSNTGLSAGTIYRYRVRSVDAAGNLSSYSSTSNTTTQALLDTIPPTISSVTLSSITSSGASVSWTTNEPVNTQVDYGLTASYGNSSTLNSSLVTSHSATLSGLSAGTAYHYRVKSRDSAGNLSQSSDNTLTTQNIQDSTAPSVPSGLTATPTSGNQIQISWSASTDTAGTGQTISGVSGYQIFRGSNLVNTTASTAYLDNGLTPGTDYSYQITAMDNAGNISAKSVSISATTQSVSTSVQRKIILVLEGTPTNKRNISGTVEFLNPSNISSKIFQSSFTTDISGQYTIDVPAGLLSTATFRPVILGYLSRLLANIDLISTSILNANIPILPAGDFNGDQLINSIDFSYMNDRWGTADSLSDINRDGVINSLDFAYISSNWLLSGE